jgi:hypothetical protein
MQHSQEALDLLEDSLWDEYHSATRDDPEINVAMADVLLKQCGFPGSVDLNKFRYGVLWTWEERSRMGIVTDAYFYEISWDPQLVRSAMINRWPLVMDQATFDMYRAHGNNPSQVITWPAGVEAFELTRVTKEVLFWEIPSLQDNGHDVQLRRDASVHLSPTTIYIGEPGNEITADSFVKAPAVWPGTPSKE